MEAQHNGHHQCSSVVVASGGFTRISLALLAVALTGAIGTTGTLRGCNGKRTPSHWWTASTRPLTETHHYWRQRHN